MHFYIPNLKQPVILPPDSAYFYTKKVKANDEFQATDLKGTKAQIKVTAVNKKTRSVSYAIINKITVEKSSPEKILIQAQIDKFYLEKLCEIAPLADITKIILFKGQKTDDQEVNFERLNKILIRCCEQSEKFFIPRIYLLNNDQELHEILSSLKPLVLDPSLDSEEYLGDNLDPIIIGPDEGWTENERQKFQELELTMISLNKTKYPAWIAGYTYFSRTNPSHPKTTT